VILDDLRNAIDLAVQTDDQAVRLIQQLKAQIVQLNADNKLLQDKLAAVDTRWQETVNGFITQLSGGTAQLQEALK